MRLEQHRRKRVDRMVPLVGLVRQRLHRLAVGILQVEQAGQRNRSRQAVLEGMHRQVELVDLHWHLHRTRMLDRRMRASSFHLALRRRPVGRTQVAVHRYTAVPPLARTVQGPGIPEVGSPAGCLPF